MFAYKSMLTAVVLAVVFGVNSIGANPINLEGDRDRLAVHAVASIKSPDVVPTVAEAAAAATHPGVARRGPLLPFVHPHLVPKPLGGLPIVPNGGIPIAVPTRISLPGGIPIGVPTGISLPGGIHVAVPTGVSLPGGAPIAVPTGISLPGGTAIPTLPVPLVASLPGGPAISVPTLPLPVVQSLPSGISVPVPTVPTVPVPIVNSLPEATSIPGQGPVPTPTLPNLPTLPTLPGILTPTKAAVPRL